MCGKCKILNKFQRASTEEYKISQCYNNILIMLAYVIKLISLFFT